MDKNGSIKPSVATLIIFCILVCLAPWLTGGKEPLALLIGSGALLLAALLFKIQSVSGPRVNRNLRIAFSLFWVWSTLSLFWSVNRHDSIDFLLNITAAGLVFWLIKLVATTPIMKQRLILGYLILAFGFSVYGLWEYTISSMPRLIGSMFLPNPAAIYLVPAIILGIAWPAKKQKNLLYGLVAGVYLAAFLLADSRGGFLALIIGIIVVLVVNKGRLEWTRCLVIAVAAGLLCLVCAQVKDKVYMHASNSPGYRIVSQELAGSRSIQDRENYIFAAFDIWSERPWAGVGAGGYGAAHVSRQRGPSDAAVNAHSLPAQVLAELGLIGLIIFLVIIYSLGLILYKSMRKSRQQAVLGAAFMALAAHFLIDTSSSYPAILSLAAVLLACSSGEETVDYLNDTKYVGLLTLAFLQIVVAGIIYQSDSLAARAGANQLMGEYDVAADLYARAGNFWGSNPDYITSEGINLLVLATTSGNKYQMGVVADLANRAQKLDPFDAQHFYLEGRVRAALGEANKAESLYARAIKLDPYNRPEYFISLVTLLKSSQHNDRAIQVARQLLDRYDDKTIELRKNDASIKVGLARLWSILSGIYLDSGEAKLADGARKRAIEIYKAP